jgi:hypothetical protein
MAESKKDALAVFDAFIETWASNVWLNIVLALATKCECANRKALPKRRPVPISSDIRRKTPEDRDRHLSLPHPGEPIDYIRELLKLPRFLCDSRREAQRPVRQRARSLRCMCSTRSARSTSCKQGRPSQAENQVRQPIEALQLSLPKVLWLLSLDAGSDGSTGCSIATYNPFSTRSAGIADPLRRASDWRLANHPLIAKWLSYVLDPFEIYSAI